MKAGLAAAALLLCGARVDALDDRLVLVDETGQELVGPSGTTLVGASDPVPEVRLNPVSMRDIETLAGGRLRIRVSGEVGDALADLVPDHKADITVVTVDEQPLAVKRIPQTPTATRPFAFRGRFAGVVTIERESIPEMVLVIAKNVLGRDGVDSFDIEYDTSVTPQVDFWTGNDPLGKFFEPFILTLGELDARTPDTLVLFQGSRDARPDDGVLHETGPGTLVFEGATASLGDATFVLKQPPADAGAGMRALVGEIASRGLLIQGQVSEFIETARGSGVFRSIAEHLPDDTVLEIQLETAPAGGRRVVKVRRGPWQVFAAERVWAEHKRRLDVLGDAQPGPASVLTESAPGSRVFEGEVAGLGRTRVALKVAEPRAVEILLTSSGLGLSDYWLQLRAVDERRFRSRAIGPDHLPVTPWSVQERMTSVRMNGPPGGVAGRFQPIWVVAKDRPSLAPGEYGEAGGRRFELTTEPLAPGLPRSVRFRLPFVLATGLTRDDLPNVVRVAQPPQEPFGPRSIVAFEPAAILEELALAIRR